MISSIICPVCKRPTGFYKWKDPKHLVPTVTEAYPLYQRGYVDEPRPGLQTCQQEDGNDNFYISPRCHKCYDKEIKKWQSK